MSPHEKASIRRLREGLAFHDKFEAVSNDQQIYVEQDNCLYEFAVEDSEGEALRLGDLRTILALPERAVV